MSERIAPNTTNETAAYLRDEVEAGNSDWYRKCLMVQRIARGLPAVYPTAFSASQATPGDERVFDPKKWKRGMVGYCYDPRIEGTAGHIFFVAGRNKEGQIITCSNDVKGAGMMDYVPLSFYTNVWGHKIQFASSWLNGYDFKDESKPPKPTKQGNLNEQYEQLRDELVKIYRVKKNRLGETHALVKALKRDVDRMDKKLKRWS